MDSEKGSKIAKGGFKNEHDVVKKFNSWKGDLDAQKWLEIMEYDLEEIEYVKAEIVHGYKTDVQVHITIKLIKLIDAQNIQVKLVKNIKGFNQVDKRWVDKYVEIWNIPKEISTLLKYFTGELTPYKTDVKDSRRMFMNEFSEEEQDKIINFFERNKTLILCDILKGRGKFAAEWILVVQKLENTRWVLLPINVAINHYGSENVKMTGRGSLKLGKIRMQRKGGDGGRETAKMLQFKADSTELFDLVWINYISLLNKIFHIFNKKLNIKHFPNQFFKSMIYCLVINLFFYAFIKLGLVKRFQISKLK